MSGDKEIEDRVTKRNFLRAVGAGATGLAGLYAINTAELLGVGGQSSSNSNPKDQNIDYSISDPSQVRGYLDSEVIGNPERQQEWEALFSQNYNAETGEFFPGEDIDLESVDIVYNDSPGEDSGYRVTSELERQTQRSDWQWFEHDETAEDVLEYFGEL